MAQADSVLSTPPTNTPVDTTRRRFLAVPDLASPDNHPFKTRNGRLTIPAHRLHDHVKVDMYRVQAVAGGTAAAFSWEAQMNYQAFTNDSLTMMYEAIRGGLEADDALKRQGLAIRFRVRETPDWKKHAADLESEMLKRGMRFEDIDWSEDQPAH